MSEMEQRENLCESLGGGPEVARFNTPLRHLSHPTLQGNVDTSARLPASCFNWPFQLVFLLQPIPHSYFRFQPSADESCSRVTPNERSPALGALLRFTFASFLCGLCPSFPPSLSNMCRPERCLKHVHPHMFTHSCSEGIMGV